MKRILDEILKIICYMLVLIWLLIKVSVMGLIKAPIIVKILIGLAYVGLGAAYIYKRPLFFVLAGVMLVVIFIASLYVINEFRDSGENCYSGCKYKTSIPFFDGLSKDAAKAEYRRLMKQYHPDNGKYSDLSKTQEIAMAYSQYLAQFGR